MNESPMKTSVNTGDVSLPPAQTAGWSVKSTAQQGDGPEKGRFGVEKWVDKPSDGRKIAETTRKTQFDTMKWEIPDEIALSAFLWDWATIHCAACLPPFPARVPCSFFTT
jgi:hypothetical protein